MEKNYPLKFLWDIADADPNHKWTMRQTYEECGTGHFLEGSVNYERLQSYDVEGLINSELGEATVKAWLPFMLAEHKNDMANASYWKQHGYCKELHDGDKEWEKWTSYIPLSYYENKDKKYPVVFVFHGGKNTILFSETYGYLQALEGKEAIVVIPHFNQFVLILKKRLLSWNVFCL